MSDELEVMALVPRLGQTKRFRVTSPKTKEYNCIAWAAGDDERWWWPDKSKNDYWPQGVPREKKMDAFVAAYATCGYERCTDANPEPGYEKVAIFTKPAGTPAHAARQLPDGTWSSKLGPSFDIMHHDLDGVECSDYGKPTVFLRRPVVSSDDTPA